MNGFMQKISEPKVECKSLPKAERFQRFFIESDPMTSARRHRKTAHRL